jgi:F0F1-type ATP synthase assembly protein I
MMTQSRQIAVAPIAPMSIGETIGQIVDLIVQLLPLIVLMLLVGFFVRLFR